MKKILFGLIASAIVVFGLDINTASKEEFIKVKGIGAKKAEKIIAYRKEHGKFKSVDELKNVKGVSSKIIEAIKKES